MQLEELWPATGRANKAQTLSRLRKFSRGFFVTYLREKETHPPVPIASICCCPARYDPADLSPYQNWYTATNNGFLGDDIPEDNPAKAGFNALYIVSGIIHPAYRGHKLFEANIQKVVELANVLHMPSVLAGAVIPGYAKYCETHGAIEAADYTQLRRGKRLVDPLLSMYEQIGFTVPNASHVVSEYFPDSASRNYGALVVRALK